MRVWPAGGLWRHPEFLRLWAAQTVSAFGSQVTMLALPLTAALVLGASPAEMGLLTALEVAPYPVLGLLVGAWVDRRRRRPLLIAANAVRGIALLAVPAAALVGALRMEVLFVVAPLVGTLALVFDVADNAYLPALVGRDRLVEGNSKLEVTSSAAQVAGPGVAGALVGVATAPLAIVADAVSFLLAALLLGTIRSPEPRPTAVARPALRREIGEGLRVVLGSPLLRAIAACTATWNLFGSLQGAVLILYATRHLGLGPGLLGLAFALGNAGPLAGAVVAGRVARRFGVGPTIVGTAVVGGCSALLLPLAQPPYAVPALVAAGLVGGACGVVYNVTQVSLRQAITPDRLQGRMTATMRVLVWGTIPVGSLLGGALGGAIGLRPTLVVGGLGVALAWLWLLPSPVRGVRDVPPPAPEDGGPAEG